MRINIFGASCTGKSTLAAWMFAELKCRNLNVEYSHELIKTQAWAKIKPHGWKGFQVFSNQITQEYELLHAGVKNLVTDSPVLLGAIYSDIHGKRFSSELYRLVKIFDLEYPSINILLERSTPYSEPGRYETEEESKKMDEIIKDRVEEHCIKLSLPLILKKPCHRENILHWVLQNITSENSGGIFR